MFTATSSQQSTPTLSSSAPLYDPTTHPTSSMLQSGQHIGNGLSGTTSAPLNSFSYDLPSYSNGMNLNSLSQSSPSMGSSTYPTSWPMTPGGVDPLRQTSSLGGLYGGGSSGYMASGSLNKWADYTQNLQLSPGNGFQIPRPGM